MQIEEHQCKITEQRRHFT